MPLQPAGHSSPDLRTDRRPSQTIAQGRWSQERPYDIKPVADAVVPERLAKILFFGLQHGIISGRVHKTQQTYRTVYDKPCKFRSDGIKFALECSLSYEPG